MIKSTFIILSPLLFVLLWRFIAYCPALFARTANWRRQAHPLDAMLFVFSAASTNNREAEFVDERAVSGRKLVRLLRALLLLSYLLFVISWLNNL